MVSNLTSFDCFMNFKFSKYSKQVKIESNNNQIPINFNYF